MERTEPHSLSKFGKPLSRENLVMTAPYERPNERGEHPTRPQSNQMPQIYVGKRRRKLAVNKAKLILSKMTRTLSITSLAF